MRLMDALWMDVSKREGTDASVAAAKGWTEGRWGKVVGGVEEDVGTLFEAGAG